MQENVYSKTHRVPDKALGSQDRPTVHGSLLHVRPCLCTKAKRRNHRASLLGQLAPNKRPIELCSPRVEGGGSEGRG